MSETQRLLTASEHLIVGRGARGLSKSWLLRDECSTHPIPGRNAQGGQQLWAEFWEVIFSLISMSRAQVLPKIINSRIRVFYNSSVWSWDGGEAERILQGEPIEVISTWLHDFGGTYQISLLIIGQLLLCYLLLFQSIHGLANILAWKTVFWNYPSKSSSTIFCSYKACVGKLALTRPSFALKTILSVTLAIQ